LNLRVGAEYIDGMEKVGPWIEGDEGVRRLKDAPPEEVSLPADGVGDDDDDEFGEAVRPGEVGQ
jgi:hypothetical protein